MIIKTIKNVPAEPVKMDGAEKVSVKVLFGPKDNAPTFAMRVFELDKSGHTPHHTHAFEHEVVILSGQVGVVSEKGTAPLSVGDVVLVAPDEKHQFRNLSDTQPASFMCLVPIQYQK